jgi:hypothetical protein
LSLAKTIDTSTCPKCGALSDPDARVCASCGTSLEPPEAFEKIDTPNIALEPHETVFKEDGLGLINHENRVADQKTPAESNDAGPSTITTIIESVLAAHESMEPPTYGSVALKVAAEMAKIATDDGELPSELPESRLGLVADEDEIRLISKKFDEQRKEESTRTRARDSISPSSKEEVIEEARPPIRPPVLASEALREQMSPREPGRDTIRILSVLVGFSGAVITFLLLKKSDMGIALGGSFLALLVLGLPSIPYAPRAAAIFVISASTLGVATWMHSGALNVPAPVVETIGIVVLGCALLLRSWHRASITARILVAVGIIVCGSWLGMSGWLKDFTTLDPAWQSWLPTIIRAPFGLLLTLSLLAFMDSRSTGACGVWAVAILIWHGLHMGVQLMILGWPQNALVPNWSVLVHELSAVTAASIASPLLLVLVVFGVAQLLAVAANAEARSS